MPEPLKKPEASPPLTTHECSDSRPQTTAPWDEPVLHDADGFYPLYYETNDGRRVVPNARDIIARIRKLQTEVRDAEKEREAAVKALEGACEENLKQRERVRELEGLHAMEIERLSRSEQRNSELVAALEKCEAAMQAEMDDYQQHWVSRGPGSNFREAKLLATRTLARNKEAI